MLQLAEPIRLVLIKLLGCIPGNSIVRRSASGQYTFCIAEDEEDSPWMPLAAERGVPAGTSGITVMAVHRHASF